MTVDFITDIAVEVQPYTVDFTTPVAVEVQGALVDFITPVKVEVQAVPAPEFITPVAVRVLGPGVDFTTPVKVPVRRFLGTGVRLGRRYGPISPRPRAAQPPPTPPVGGPTARALLHPFWTSRLSDSAPLAATSADFVTRLAAQAALTRTSTPVAGYYDAPYNTFTNGSNTPPPFSASFALPVYLMDLDTRRVPVFSTRSRTMLQETLDAGVPLPDPTLLPDGLIQPSGTDGSVIIICGDEVWELWQFRPANLPGYRWACTQAGYMADKTSHPGIWGTPARGNGYAWGVAASGLAKSGGMLRAEDYYADSIDHPLELALPLTGADQTTSDPNLILPATRYDRMTFVPGGSVGQPAAEHLRVPEAARFRLPATFDVDGYVAALPVRTAGRLGTDPATLRKVLTCVRDYGMIVTDSAGVVSFSAEHPKTYGTPYNPFALDEAPVWGNFGQQIPWDQLVQLAAPTTVPAAVGP